MDVAGEFNYEKKAEMIKMIQQEVDKYDFFTDNNFDDRYLVGKLINILADKHETGELINRLSEELTNKSFSGRFGGEELIQIFQTLRLALINLYGKVNLDEIENWFKSE